MSTTRLMDHKRLVELHGISFIQRVGCVPGTQTETGPQPGGGHTATVSQSAGLSPAASKQACRRFTRSWTVEYGSPVAIAISRIDCVLSRSQSSLSSGGSSLAT